MKSTDQIKKLLFRVDGAADSERVVFESASGNTWEAELCLHVGVGPQSGRLKVIFRCRSRPREPQRYNDLPPGFSKVPARAAEEITEADLRELLATSVKV